MSTSPIERPSPRLGAAVPTGLLVVSVMIAAAACGGPSVPSEVPASSPLAPDAPSAPLPELGSSFSDTPISETPEAGAPHGEHGGHGHAH